MDVIHVISLGAGVQSSTMALMAAHGEITPMPTAAVFADTQAEPKSVYTWLDWLEKQLPFPVERVTRGSLTEAITTLRPRADGMGYWVYSGIPSFNVNPDGSDGHVHRQCTTSFKIEVLDRKSRVFAGRAEMLEWRRRFKAELKLYATYKKAMRLARKEKRPAPAMPPDVREAWNLMQDNALVTQWIGISIDEASRMKPSRHPWSVHRWPVIERGMSRTDCLTWMKRRGYPEPPRSACVYCPYHDDAEWVRLRDDEPEAFAEAVRVDKLYRELKGKAGLRGVPYIHVSRVPLDQVVFKPKQRDTTLSLFNNECEGMCGV
jgi:hypothetical protein